MRSISRSSSVVLTTALFASLALPFPVLAAIEVSSDPPSFGDKIPALHYEYDKYTLVKTGISADDLQSMQKSLKDTSGNVEDLKKTVSEQQRTIEDLKRSNGSSSSSSSREIDELKRKVAEQDRELDNLKRTVEDLSRKVK